MEKRLSCGALFANLFMMPRPVIYRQHDSLTVTKKPFFVVVEEEKRATQDFFLYFDYEASGIDNRATLSCERSINSIVIRGSLGSASLQHRRVLLYNVPVEVKDVSTRLPAHFLCIIVLLECEFAVCVHANDALLETVEDEREVSFEVLAARRLLDARECEICIWNEVWIDDECVLVV
jgi:hypothetical protein